MSRERVVRLQANTPKVYQRRTHDGLLGDVKFGRGVTLVRTRANTVYLVVDGSAVMVTILTSASNSLPKI